MQQPRRWRWKAALVAVAVAASPSAASALDRTDLTNPASSQPNQWVAYDAAGMNSDFTPIGDGSTGYTGVGDLRWPVFAVRVRRGAELLQADLVTPAGFDSYYVRQADRAWITADESPETRLETALSHHRPAMRLRIAPDGAVNELPSRGFQRHQGCARRLLRESLEAQMREPENVRRLDVLREWATEEHLSRRVAPPVEPAALLLRLLALPLPEDDAARTAMQELEDRLEEHRSERNRPTQSEWRFAQARAHGVSIGRAIDLRVVRDIDQARICRSLPYNRLHDLRTDTCRVEAIIDRRDGWPITLGIVREGRAVNGATETQYRSFNRVAPLEGFEPPPNPCAAAGS
jgi:hypothetical protein